jgi:hypothetical protein
MIATGSGPKTALIATTAIRNGSVSAPSRPAPVIAPRAAPRDNAQTTDEARIGMTGNSTDTGLTMAQATVTDATITESRER